MNLSFLSDLLDNLPVLDLHPSGFLKGVGRTLLLLVLTFVVGGLQAVLPSFQDFLTHGGPMFVTVVSGSVISVLAGVLKWLTTKRDSLQEGDQPVA